MSVESYLYDVDSDDQDQDLEETWLEIHEDFEDEYCEPDVNVDAWDHCGEVHCDDFHDYLTSIDDQVCSDLETAEVPW